jgi:hypothetical protein
MYEDRHPQMTEVPGMVDVMTMIRNHIDGNDAANQALLIDCRLDPYTMLTLLTDIVVDLGSAVYGSVEDFDRELEQRLRDQLWR